MGSLVKKVMGGTDKSSLKAQQAANEQSQRYIQDTVNQARGESKDLFGGATRNRNMGYQQGLDVLGQSMPQQADLFSQGNYGAQQALLGGMDPFRQAIMGQPVDTSQMQAQRFNYDPSFMQQQLPQFQNPVDMLGGGPAQEQGPGMGQRIGQAMQGFSQGWEGNGANYLDQLQSQAGQRSANNRMPMPQYMQPQGQGGGMGMAGLFGPSLGGQSQGIDPQVLQMLSKMSF